MPKVHIAFSIAGTGVPISASRIMSEFHFEEMILGGHGYEVVKSHRPDYDYKKDGLKIEWKCLMNENTGLPTKDPLKVLKCFNALKEHGWEVLNEETFKHFHNLE